MSTDIKDVVKEKYGEAALRVLNGGSSCCSTTCCGDTADPITSSLYDDAQATQIPEEALKASWGAATRRHWPTLNPGETVLDLGSGGGIDVLLSARARRAHGKAYGLDMTDEMLALARENQRKAGIENVEFLKGKSRTFRCRTIRSTSSFPIASSILSATKTRCYAKPFAF